jgi:DNA/RNA-binding domain of Phe-tRNA-synthetase-like protein
MSNDLVVRATDDVRRRFPGYQALVVTAEDLENGPSDDFTADILAEATAKAKTAFASGPVSAHPHVAAWRAAYSQFGSKPSRYRSSVEALLRRAIGDGVPRINRLVDIYNAVSLAHVIPVGGENSAVTKGAVVLKSATGDETIADLDLRDSHSDTVPAGEVVWQDDIGITCRRWNWRQCRRTALGESVTRAWFVLDALAPFGVAELDAAAHSLVDALRTISPAATTTVRALAG